MVLDRQIRQFENAKKLIGDLQLLALKPRVEVWKANVDAQVKKLGQLVQVYCTKCGRDDMNISQSKLCNVKLEKSGSFLDKNGEVKMILIKDKSDSFFFVSFIHYNPEINTD